MKIYYFKFIINIKAKSFIKFFFKLLFDYITFEKL